MQTFSWKIAKLTDRITVEIDRRWTRAATRKGQAHIDFNLVDRINYWVTQSRGAALTGHLVLTDSQGRKLALKCSGFGVDGDFVEFLRASSAILAAIGEARPDLGVAVEPTATHRNLMAGVILATVIVVGGAMVVFGADGDMPTKIGAVVGALIAGGYAMFRYGPWRKKPKPVAPADLVRTIMAQTPELLLAPRGP